jgi:hypothetical protein
MAHRSSQEKRLGHAVLAFKKFLLTSAEKILSSG